jgi:anti-anti-sigma regulatory factor
MYSASARRTVPVVAWTPDLGHACSAGLRTRLVDVLGSHGPRLVLDLRALSEFDAALVRAIQDAAGRADRRGGWLRVVTDEPGVAQALRGPMGAGVYSSVPRAVAAP